jgi:hypothetical protein
MRTQYKAIEDIKAHDLVTIDNIEMTVSKYAGHSLVFDTATALEKTYSQMEKLKLFPNRIFNKPKRSLPMWISKDKLEKMIDERVDITIRAFLDARNYDTISIVSRACSLGDMIAHPLRKDIHQNQAIELILKHIGMRLENEPQRPSEVKLVKIPKVKNGKKD